MLSTVLHLVRMTNAKNATSKQEEGSKVDPSEETMISVANEKVAKVEVNTMKQRKLEEDLDFVKEKLHILFVMPKGENGKLQTEAVGQLRSWFQGQS